jgi:hypothetical protein
VQFEKKDRRNSQLLDNYRERCGRKKLKQNVGSLTLGVDIYRYRFTDLI